MTEWADTEKIFSYRNLSLVLSGHYCGGQCRLFGLGPVYVPMRINNITQHISSGLAASGIYPMPIRLFNVPSVALLSFTAKLQ